MTIHKLHHVNVITANMPALVTFYEQVMGFARGERPPFDANGAWLYCDGSPVVHLVERDSQPKVSELRVEHFAFTGTDLEEFLAHLRRLKIPYDVFVAPVIGIKQVNLHDPDGNHFEVLFGPEEMADISPYNG